MPAQVAAHPSRHTPPDAVTMVGLRQYSYISTPGSARRTGLRRELVVATARGRLPALLGPVPNRGDGPSDAALCVGGLPPTTGMCHVAQGGPGFTIMRSTSQAASEAATHDIDAAQPSSVSVSRSTCVVSDASLCEC